MCCFCSRKSWFTPTIPVKPLYLQKYPASDVRFYGHPGKRNVSIVKSDSQLCRITAKMCFKSYLIFGASMCMSIWQPTHRVLLKFQCDSCTAQCMVSVLLFCITDNFYQSNKSQYHSQNELGSLPLASNASKPKANKKLWCIEVDPCEFTQWFISSNYSIFPAPSMFFSHQDQVQT